MKTYFRQFSVSSVGKRPTFHDVTKEVNEIIKDSGIESGICLIFSRHTTCAVMIDEDSIDKSYSGLTFLQQDLVDVFENIIPTCRKEGQYMHPGPKLTIFSAKHGEDKPGTLNTDAHLRSSIVGRSEIVPVVNKKIEIGEFGHIFFVDFDHTRERERKVIVQVLGE